MKFDYWLKIFYHLYKKRQTIRGYQFEPDNGSQLLFAQGCPFKETPDQLAAIRDIKEDMESNRPMDRLLCGDVGFGKTEVLLRAAVKAVFNPKQVMNFGSGNHFAFDQHYNTFMDRCRGFDITIGLMSRMVSSRQNSKPAI